MANKKPKGHLEYILGLDCETTGLCFSVDNPSHNPETGEKHQAVSWGIIVIDAATLKPLEKKYIEVKWNEDTIRQHKANPKFGTFAEKIHGLSFEHLEEHGVTEEEAAFAILGLIHKYWQNTKTGKMNAITCLGHNFATFDLPFLKNTIRSGFPEVSDKQLRFANRHVDTFSAGFCTIGSVNSDDLFDTMGLPERKLHNALEDIEHTLESARRIRKLWQAKVKLNAYD